MMTWSANEIVTVVALLLGPALAVFIARLMEYRRARHERRMDIFRTLMKTRRSRLLPDHVSALNLVEVEFRKNPNVIAAWRSYFEHLGSEQPRRTDELLSDDFSGDEKRMREERYNTREANEREKLLATLLHTIARSLNYKVEALEIFEGG